MKMILTLLFITLTIFIYGQTKKIYFPAWTFPQNNTTVDGISVGLWNFSDKPRNTTTNGLRLSLIGEGFFIPFLPQSPVIENDSAFRKFMKEDIIEHINGISLSGTGNAGNYVINGIALGSIGQLNAKVNGISVAMFNYAQIHHGIQACLFTNESYEMKGLQIGLFNRSKKTRGIQIGLWNINEQRKLPIINWNFCR